VESVVKWVRHESLKQPCGRRQIALTIGISLSLERRECFLKTREQERRASCLIIV